MIIQVSGVLPRSFSHSLTLPCRRVVLALRARQFRNRVYCARERELAAEDFGKESLVGACSSFIGRGTRATLILGNAA